MRTLVRGLPANFEAPVVIVQHLSAESPGLLPEILAQGAQLRVTAASDGAPLETGGVHVAIPNHHLLIDSSGRLRLSRGPKENRSRPAIDPMFRSAALAFGARVIGVVLTGYLSDGSAGLKAVKLCGGACVRRGIRLSSDRGCDSGGARLRCNAAVSSRRRQRRRGRLGDLELPAGVFEAFAVGGRLRCDQRGGYSQREKSDAAGHRVPRLSSFIRILGCFGFAC